MIVIGALILPAGVGFGASRLLGGDDDGASGGGGRRQGGPGLPPGRDPGGRAERDRRAGAGGAVGAPARAEGLRGRPGHQHDLAFDTSVVMFGKGGQACAPEVGEVVGISATEAMDQENLEISEGATVAVVLGEDQVSGADRAPRARRTPPRDPGRIAGSRPSPTTLAAICVAVFLVGMVAAMVLTQRLRSEGPIASQIAFKADEGPRYRVCFQTPRDDTFEVAIVDASGDRRPRAGRRRRARGGTRAADKASAHCFDWDGLDDRPAPRRRPAPTGSGSTLERGRPQGGLGREAEDHRGGCAPAEPKGPCRERGAPGRGLHRRRGRGPRRDAGARAAPARGGAARRARDRARPAARRGLGRARLAAGPPGRARAP